VYSVAARRKHDSFQQEDEWRAIRVEGARRDVAEPKRRFRTRKGFAVPYVEVELGNPLPITSIQVGPAAGRAAVDAIKLLRDTYPHKLKIEDTAITASGSPLDP
jgi:hypothetical protein